jgi:hypothetical protein
VKSDPQRDYAQRVHSRRRARQRMHVKLNRNLRGQMVADIERGRAVSLGDGIGAGYRMYAVRYRGSLWAKVAYDAERRQVVTVLHLTPDERLAVSAAEEAAA